MWQSVSGRAARVVYWMGSFRHRNNGSRGGSVLVHGRVGHHFKGRTNDSYVLQLIAVPSIRVAIKARRHEAM